MDRNDAIPYVGFVIDTALSADHQPADVDMERATLVGWQCGFEPLFVAVVGATMDTKGVRDTVDEELAEEIAKDYLTGRKWFSNLSAENAADYILVP